MYNNIKSCILFNGNFSASFVSETGVRQGENLSPILFSLFLNDLSNHLLSDNCTGIHFKDNTTPEYGLKLLTLLYADDTIIISDSKEDFQKSLDSFYSYSNTWHLKINTSKTKAVIFGARQLRNFNFKLGNDSLELVDQYHYLVVTFSSNGSFFKARKHVAQQANKALHLLYYRCNNADFPIDLKIKLFDHTILPILTYGSEIFGYENIDILEKIHNDFLRKITNTRKSTPRSPYMAN